MSSISSTNLSQLFSAQRPPPPSGGKSRVSDAIQSEAASGQISSTDATALTSALDSIDSSLSADRASAQGTASSSTSSTSDSRLDPSKMKDRIDGLIADQVTNGTLTSDQADTLKQIFAQGPSQQGQGSNGDDQDKGFSVDATGSSGGTGKVHHHGHHGGPPPSDSADDSSSTTDASGTSGTTSSSSSTTSSVTDLLKTFMDQLQASQSNASGYTGGGTSSSNRQASALLFDFNS